VLRVARLASCGNGRWSLFPLPGPGRFRPTFIPIDNRAHPIADSQRSRHGANDQEEKKQKEHAPKICEKRYRHDLLPQRARGYNLGIEHQPHHSEVSYSEKRQRGIGEFAPDGFVSSENVLAYRDHHEPLDQDDHSGKNGQKCENFAHMIVSPERILLRVLTYIIVTTGRKREPGRGT